MQASAAANANPTPTNRDLRAKVRQMALRLHTIQPSAHNVGVVTEFGRQLAEVDTGVARRFAEPVCAWLHKHAEGNTVDVLSAIARHINGTEFVFQTYRNGQRANTDAGYFNSLCEALRALEE